MLFGYTGKEDASPSYVFNQEPNFYYLTGHNEEGAALLLVPPGAAEKGWKGRARFCSCPPRDLAGRALEWRAHGPDDPGIVERRRASRRCEDVRANSRRDSRSCRKTIPELYTRSAAPTTPVIRTRANGRIGCRSADAPELRCRTRGGDRRDAPDQIAGRNRAAHQGHRSLGRRATGRHAHGASRTLRISGGREDGGDSRGGRLRNRSLRAHRRHRLSLHGSALQRTGRADHRTATWC